MSRQEIHFPVGISAYGILTGTLSFDRYFSVCTDVHVPFIFNIENEDVEGRIDGMVGTESEEDKGFWIKWAEQLGFDKSEEESTDDNDEDYENDEGYISDNLVKSAFNYIVKYLENNSDEALEVLYDCSCAYGCTPTINGEKYHLESSGGGQHDPRKDEGFVPYDNELIRRVYAAWDNYHLKYREDMSEEDLAVIENLISDLATAGYTEENQYDFFDSDSTPIISLIKEYLESSNTDRIQESIEESFLRGAFSFATSTEYMVELTAEEDKVSIDWDILNKDDQIIEQNFIKILKRELVSANDEGHLGDDTLGGSITVSATSVPAFLYTNMQDNSLEDNDRLVITYLNEKVNEYSKELLEGTSSMGYLLLENASWEIHIDNPNELYLSELL